MGLTRTDGPLSSYAPKTVNYTIDGPPHKLLMHPFPRRVRAEFAGRTVLDTRDGQLVHESNLLPVLYVPTGDLDADALVDSDHTTHCPFKGDASYRSLKIGDRVAENAVWTYPEPTPDAQWLRGYSALYWNSADAWYDEDEEVFAHLTDPFTRVDVRPTHRHVVVRHGDTVIADAQEPVVLSETGLPNRYYLAPEDVRVPLRPSTTRMRCPYKGESSYWNLALPDGTEVDDGAWSYPDPLPESARIAGRLSFVDGPDSGLTIEVDGRPA